MNLSPSNLRSESGFGFLAKLSSYIKGVGSETANEDVGEVNDDDTKVSNTCISCRFECFYQ